MQNKDNFSWKMKYKVSLKSYQQYLFKYLNSLNSEYYIYIVPIWAVEKLYKVFYFGNCDVHLSR